MSKSKRGFGADTPDGQAAGEAIVEAVENQLRDNAPPEARLTLKRLMAMGETRYDAVRFMACALSVEAFEVMKDRSPYDEQRYIRNLHALPKLPFDDEE